MRRTVRFLTSGIAFLAAAVAGNSGGTKTLLELEKPGIDRITRLTEREHATILFTIENEIVGYAKEGRVEWIGPTTEPEPGDCKWPHPALSHDGLRVAFVTYGATPKHCRIVIRDMPRSVQRDLIETSGDPGEISWSWDDSEICFSEDGIFSVSVRDNARKRLLPKGLWLWGTMQWLHNGNDLVIEKEVAIPQKEPGHVRYQGNLLLVHGGEARFIDVGKSPAVSPLSDRIAYFSSGKIVAINADQTEKVILAKAPLGPLLMREELIGSIAWSPDGNRLFFGTIVSDNYNDKRYLVDVQSGRRETFLSHTSIEIKGWR